MSLLSENSIQQQTSAPLPHSNDAEVVSTAQSGSLDAFEEIVRRHETRIFKYLLSRTANRHDAEDMLQETFLRAYRKLNSYDRRWSLAAWLFAIASNLASSFRSKKTPATTSNIDAFIATGQNPQSMAADNESDDNLWHHARNVLTSDQYDAIWLKYAEDMDVRQIADAMGKSAGNIKVLLHRGRVTLAKSLTQSRYAKPMGVIAQSLPLGGK